MKKFLFALAILIAVSGTVAPATVYAEHAGPATPEQSTPVEALGATACTASADTVRYNRPQTRGWFEEATGYGSFCPPTFAEALAELDAYWDAESAKNCTLRGCQPRFGGALTMGYCDQVEFRWGDIFWGGWYNPLHLPEGVEPLLLEEQDGFSGVYRVTAERFRIPSIPPYSICAGGRWLRELQYGFLPLMLR